MQKGVLCLETYVLALAKQLHFSSSTLVITELKAFQVPSYIFCAVLERHTFQLTGIIIGQTTRASSFVK